MHLRNKGFDISGCELKYSTQEDISSLQKESLYNTFKKDENLNNIRFIGLDLSNFNFQDSNLDGAYFESCNLNKTDFRRSNLRNATFHQESTTFNRNTDSRYFAGADLTSSKLPNNISNFDNTLNLLTDAAKNARNMFILLIPICFYVFVSIWLYETKDDHYLLPLSNLSLSKENFVLAASMMILGIYTSLHIYLIKMWNQMSYLPRRFQGGIPVIERTYPWLIEVVPKIKTIC